MRGFILLPTVYSRGPQRYFPTSLIMIGTGHLKSIVGNNGAQTYNVPYIPFSLIAGSLKRGYLLCQIDAWVFILLYLLYTVEGPSVIIPTSLIINGTGHLKPIVGKNGAQKYNVPYIPFSLIAGSLKRGYLLYQNVTRGFVMLNRGAIRGVPYEYGLHLSFYMLCVDLMARCDLLSGLQLDCLPDKDMSCVSDYTNVVEAVTAQVKTRARFDPPPFRNALQ